jgi:hypothetical protein
VSPANLPLPLPIVHTSIARWFGSIVSQGRLEPRQCPVFGERLIYLFYGGAFYRPSEFTTKNVDELPVAFLFEPAALTKIARYYPFDTGALVSGRLGASGDRLRPFRSAFQVPGGDIQTPTRMVHHLFNSNENYIYGRVDPDCQTKPSPLPELFELMTQDLTSKGTDHRQCCIECHSVDAMELGQHLLWLAFPENHYPYFVQLFGSKRWKRIPVCYPYRAHAIFHTREIAYDIHQQALRFIELYRKAA